MTNIAEMVVARGFAEVIRHKDDEARSNHYEALFAAEFHARAARKGMHSGKDAPAITDFLMVRKSTSYAILTLLKAL